jgi:tetratricopeptide (TPR) repeat protein
MRFFSIFLLGGLLVTAFSVNAQSIKDLASQNEKNDPRFIANAEAFAKANPSNAEAYIWLTRARIKAKKYESAIEAGEQAVELAPNNPQAHFWLGNAYGSRINQVSMLSKMSMAGKLRDAYEAAVKHDPNLIEARHYLIQYYMQAPSAIGGSREKALAQATEISKRDAVQGHIARASIAMTEKKPAEALKFYEAAYKAKPSDDGIRMAVGLGYQQTSRWEDAYQHFKTWTGENDKAATAWYQLGRTAAMSGKYLEEGEQALQRYLKIPRTGNEPKNQNAYYRLGQVQARAGKKAEARASLQAAIKLDPKMKEAKEELAKL